MNKISSFCNSLKDKYPNTKEILEQIEELRDTLHIKTEEYQNDNTPYDEAVDKAIESLGNLEGLFTSLSKSETLVYFRYALITANIISGTIIGIIMFLYARSLSLDVFEMRTALVIFSFILLSILSFMVFYNFSELKKPIILTSYYKTYKKQMIISLSIWFLYSLASLFSEYYSSSIKYTIFGVIGFLNWPLSVIITRLILKSKKFNLKS